MEEHIGLTAFLSEAFSSTRKVGFRTTQPDSAIGQTSIYTPSDKISVQTTGLFKAVQLRMPLDRLKGIALEDHELDLDCINLESYDGTIDFVLLGLLCNAFRQPAAAIEMERSIVAHLLRRAEIVRLKPASKGGIAPARLKRVIDHVEADICNVTLASMADQAALSPFHFARSFHASMGRPPWQYVIERHIARAMTLLTESNLGLEEMAKQSVFSSSSHLISVMRKNALITPNNIRQIVMLDRHLRNHDLSLGGKDRCIEENDPVSRYNDI